MTYHEYFSGNESAFWDAFTAGALGSLFIGAIIFAILLCIGIYVYTAIAWMTIGKKLKYKYPWLAWIPIANGAMVLQLGRFHWAWIFLVLIPILGWIALFVLIIIATWRIFEDRRYPGWFSLSLIVPKVGGILYLVALGFVAWKDKPKMKKRK